MYYVLSSTMVKLESKKRLCYKVRQKNMQFYKCCTYKNSIFCVYGLKEWQTIILKKL